MNGDRPERCAYCGAWIEGKHKCDPARARRFESARKADRDRVTRRRTEGERLYEGLKMLGGDEE
jgi:hypothetical protein